MKDMSSVLLVVSIIMSSLMFVTVLVLIIVHVIYGPEAANELLRIMLQC